MSYALLALFSLVVIVLVSTFARKLGVAAPLVLVVIGIVCSFLPGLPVVDFPPELILALVLPPLLYSAAVTVPLVDFRRNIKAITGLSVLLVIVSALLSGLLFWWLFPGLTLAAAIALGAVISPTDAVAATSIGKRLGLPPRLVTVLEGEGLVNDASALVLLRSAVAATAGAVTLWEIAGDFAFAVIAAIIAGLVVGYVTVWFRAKLDNPILNTTISFAVPFLAYAPAEAIHASGVLAVVVAGLVTGHRSAKYFSAQDRITERINWRTVQFVLENGVFLLMGLELKPLIEQVKDDNLGVDRAVLFGILATVLLIVVRILFVIPLIALLRRDQRRAERTDARLSGVRKAIDTWKVVDERSERGLRRLRHFLTRRQADVDFLRTEGLGWRGGAVLAWSGMRGVVTLAAAQSLPTSIPYRPQLILIAFTVAVVTLLVQGSTLPLLIRRLGIVGTSLDADRVELAGLLAEIGGLGVSTLDNPELRQDSGEPFDPEVVELVRHDSMLASEAVTELTVTDSVGPLEQRRELRLRVLQAERAALLDARSTGSYSSRITEHAAHMLDLEESRLTQLGGDADER